MDMANAPMRLKESVSRDTLRWLPIFAIGLLYFFASWTNAFGFGRWFYAPTILVCVVSLLAAAEMAKDRALLRGLDMSHVFFCGFLVWTGLACLTNPNAKSLGYVFAYLFTFIGMATLLRLIVVRYSAFRRVFYRFNEYGVLAVCIFCFAEFIGRYSLGIGIQGWVPRGVAATAVYFNFPRVYGFSEEPTYLCWYLNTLGLLAIYTRWSLGERALGKHLFTAVVVTAWAMTFSTAGFAFLLGGFSSAAVALAFKEPQRLRGAWDLRWVWLRNCSLVATLIVVIGFGVTRDYRPLLSGIVPAWVSPDIALMDSTGSDASGSPVFFQGMLEKVTLTETHGIPRIQQWREHFALALQHPLLGLGPGYFSSKGEDSSLNLFIFVGAEQGLPAMLLLALGFFVTGVQMLRSKVRGSMIFLAGYVAGTAHLLTMTQHFHPALWLFIAAFYSERAGETADAAGMGPPGAIHSARNGLE